MLFSSLRRIALSRLCSLQWNDFLRGTTRVDHTYSSSLFDYTRSSSLVDYARNSYSISDYICSNSFIFDSSADFLHNHGLTTKLYNYLSIHISMLLQTLSYVSFAMISD